MINAKDYVEKCVTFVLAHLFAFATAKLFCILSNFGGFVCPATVLPLHLLPCQVWDRPHKRQLRQCLTCSQLGCTSINVSIRVAMAAQLELWPLHPAVLSFTRLPSFIIIPQSICSFPIDSTIFFEFTIFDTRSLGALRAPTSSWRRFGPLDFVLRALRALRPCDPRVGDWIVW